VTANAPGPPEPTPIEGWAGVDLAAIWDVSHVILQDQVKVVERAVVAGIQGLLDPERRMAAGREAHKLAGSLGTFGFADGSRLARTLELAFAGDEPLDAAHALALSRVVLDLQSELDRPLPAPPRPAAGLAGGPAGDGAPTLLVVDGDADRARRVVEAAAGQRVHAVAAATISAARALVAAAEPDVVVLDADIDGEHEVTAFLAELAARRPVVASVLVVGHASMAGRVGAARVGVRAVLERPMAPDAVVGAVRRLVARGHRAAAVLAVDDDPLFLVLISELLGAEGLVVETLNDAGALWSTLKRVEPDLLLLDNDMPGVDGVSLCRAIRSDERWARLPVVFLSGTTSAEAVRAMFNAGADDFVSKPVSAENLVTRVTNRIERSRAQAERADVDLASGLPLAGAFLRDADRLLSVARRDGRTAVLAVAELDPPGPFELAAVGRLMRLAAEPEDVVGAWSGGRLAALLYGSTGPEAAMRLESVLRAAKGGSGPTGPHVSIGVAVCPDDGPDVRALGVAAETALGRARQVPGNAIELHAAPGQGRAEVVDVLLVDDDEALGTLVVHALSGRGIGVRWLRDGAEAVELLDDPAFRARSVLLDVGLPGLDGLSVLRHLGRLGKLETSRVVMLTVRTNEHEVIEALDLGAFDHVAKPFSLPVLVHRVRRAIEASG